MSDLPKIEWLGDNHLLFTCSSSLTLNLAKQAISHWREALMSQPGEQRVNLIWDCRSLEDYDGSAIAVWTTALQEMHRMIKMVWIVSSSDLVRMAAELTVLTAQLPFQSVDSIQQVATLAHDSVAQKAAKL